MRLNTLFYIGGNKEYSRTFFVVHVARTRSLDRRQYEFDFN